METTTTPISEKIITGLRNAATELEYLRVQIALGKAEAKDLFEEMKAEFKQGIRKAQDRFNLLKKEEHVLKLINSFEFLQVQLALGKAETVELFSEQSKRILYAIREIERNIETNPTLKELHGDIRIDLEKFKMKLELIELHYKLNKLKTEYNFEERKTEFLNGLEKLKEKLLEKENVAKDKLDHFKSEVSQAVNHLKKAFH